MLTKKAQKVIFLGKPPKNSHQHDFNDLACQVVKYLQGHPLAIKVVGSALFAKPVHIWRSELDRLQMYPNLKIQQKLQPTFDLLDFDQKRIFLDIACSLIGENIDVSTSVLSINCRADANIDVLVDKSLSTISPDDFSLQMHELVRSMAREVLRVESDKPIWLWGPLEVCAAIGEGNVTETIKVVEVLVLLLEKSTKRVHIDCKSFSRMKKLRILKICHPEPKEFGRSCQLSISKDFGVNFSGSLDFLSNELRLIYWHAYPFKFLPSSFYPENVVAIDLSFSNIKSFWTTPKCLKRLKVMKIRHCHNLKTTPDFTEMVNLEKLILEGCVSLVKLHPSIGMLKKLVLLNVKGCIQIKSFPCKVEMDSLQVLILSGCLKLDNLTQVSGTLKSLEKLYVDGTAITEFPSFISSLTSLQVLAIGRFQQTKPPTWRTSIFQKQPQCLVLPSLASLRLLTELEITNCNISEVCHDIGVLSYLQYLNLSGNNFTKLPGSLSHLSRLGSLFLGGCKKLEVLPELSPSIWRLDGSQCTSLQEPPRLIQRQNFLHWSFTDCPKMFGNVTINSSVSMLQTRLMDLSRTSHASTNQLSVLIDYWGIRSWIHKFFSESGGFLSKYKKLEITFNGNSIPRWFTHKNKGSHVNVKLPPNWCYSKFKGYAFFVIFTVKKSCNGPPGYSVNNFDEASIFRSPGGSYMTIEMHDTDMKIWLCIRTGDRGWKEAMDFVTFTFGDDKKVDVKECGVRLVCDDDEDLKRDETLLSMTEHLPTQNLHTGILQLLGDDVYMSFYW